MSGPPRLWSGPFKGRRKSLFLSFLSLPHLAVRQKETTKSQNTSFHPAAGDSRTVSEKHCLQAIRKALVFSYTWHTRSVSRYFLVYLRSLQVSKEWVEPYFETCVSNQSLTIWDCYCKNGRSCVQPQSHFVTSDRVCSIRWGALQMSSMEVHVRNMFLSDHIVLLHYIFGWFG